MKNSFLRIQAQLEKKKNNLQFQQITGYVVCLCLFVFVFVPNIKIPGAAVIVLTCFPGGEGCVFLLVGDILSSIRKGRVICSFVCLVFSFIFATKLIIDLIFKYYI